MHTISYLDLEGNLSKDYHEQMDPQVLLKGYYTMALTRHIDARMINLQRQGTITFAMSSLGEEACSVASAAALQPQDWIYPQYREAAVFFWRGGTPQQYIHHMFCDEKDIILGRQMPNHFGSRELNIVQVSSPIATKIPHAAGCGYAMRMQKEKAIAICYFGEGASSEGDFHVGLNFAAVRKSQVIFFCRNNGYAISTPCSEQFASDGVASKGSGYGMEAMRIDGNDFFAIYDAVSKARKYCLEQKAPVLIEAMTYRMGAHSTSDDPSIYRSDEEVKSWEPKDPLLRLSLYLKKQNLWSDDQEKKMQESIIQDVDAAIAEAKTCGKPSLRTLFEDVYFEMPPSLERQFEQRQKESSRCPS